MRELLLALVKELKRQRAAGVDSIYIEDASLQRLRRALDHLPPAISPAPSIEPSPTAASVMAAPEPIFPRHPSPLAIESSGERGILPLVPKLPPPPVVVLPPGSKRERWEWLRQRVLHCPICRQHVRLAEGKKVVFGVGNLEASIFFCGEAPGAEEEDQGEPFVGRAGQLLDKIIQAMGLTRSDVYISNIMNWRPEMPQMDVGNRPPTEEEMNFCRPYLIAQLQVVQPRVIVALGNTAISGLLGPDAKRQISNIRGVWQKFSGIPLMPTYHPSYLLRNQSLQTKRLVWEHMLQVMEAVGLPISEKQRGYFR